jgi:hypothetical protein
MPVMASTANHYTAKTTVDDANSLGQIQVPLRKTQTYYASKEVQLEVNTEKAKYMFMTYHHNAGQNLL